MKLFFGLLFLLSSTVHAANSTTALRLICMPMNTQPEFFSCIQIFANYSYYDENALRICATMRSNFDKISCMDSVGDATFEKVETDLCAAETLDTAKQSCLDTHGTAYP